MQSIELLYDLSVNDTFGQYVFWIENFENITGIQGTEESSVSFAVDRGGSVINLNVGNELFTLSISDETLMDKLVFDGSLIIISVPVTEESDLQAYTLLKQNNCKGHPIIM